MNIYDKLYSSSKYNDKMDYKIDIVQEWLYSTTNRNILDMGCGKGHYIKHLRDNKYDVTGVEPSKVACSKIKPPVINTDILGFASTNKKKWEAMYCMDVLEHIPPEEIDATLQALVNLAPVSLYGIANHSDVIDGVELHLIQEDSKWWKAKLSEYYKEVKLTYEPLRYMVFEVKK